MSGRLIGSWTLISKIYHEELLKYMRSLPRDIELQQGSLELKNERHPRLFEYASVLEHIHAQDDGVKVLDIGGAGSLLGFFLASHGAKVCATDLMHKNVENAIAVAERLDLCRNFTARKWDISDGKSPWGNFDVVVSINVIEHIMEWARKSRDFAPGLTDYWAGNHVPSKTEVDAEQAFVRGMTAVVRPGGKLIITFDYKSCGGFKSQPRCAFLRSPEDVMERIVSISGLKLDGELDLTPRDNTDGFEPPASTGIVVLKK